jgi:hypothetical protein
MTATDVLPPVTLPVGGHAGGHAGRLTVLVVACLPSPSLMSSRLGHAAPAPACFGVWVPVGRAAGSLPGEGCACSPWRGFDFDADHVTRWPPEPPERESCLCGNVTKLQTDAATMSSCVQSKYDIRPGETSQSRHLSVSSAELHYRPGSITNFDAAFVPPIEVP